MHAASDSAGDREGGGGGRGRREEGGRREGGGREPAREGARPHPTPPPPRLPLRGPSPVTWAREHLLATSAPSGAPPACLAKSPAGGDGNTARFSLCKPRFARGGRGGRGATPTQLLSFAKCESAPAARPSAGGDPTRPPPPAPLPPPSDGEGRWGAPAPSPTPLETWAPGGRRAGMLPSPGRGGGGEGR